MQVGVEISTQLYSAYVYNNGSDRSLQLLSSKNYIVIITLTPLGCYAYNNKAIRKP